MTIERVTSPAAIDAWLVEDHALPLVALRFAFPGGAALDPTGKSGLAAMAVSLLDEGAGPYDTAAFKTRLDDLVIGMRFEAGRDEIVGSLRTLKANLGQAVELLRLTLTAPRFEASAIERVRGEFVASLFQEAQNPRALSGRLWMRDAFEDHPYGGNVYGTAESIAAITRDDLSGFVAARLHRAGLVIGAVGDVTRNELTALVDRAFGDLPGAAKRSHFWPGGAQTRRSRLVCGAPRQRHSRRRRISRPTDERDPRETWAGLWGIHRACLVPARGADPRQCRDRECACRAVDRAHSC